MDVRARSATVDATVVKPRHIGIVACSAEGAALCYRTIVHEGAAVLGEHEHPEITLSSLPLARYMGRIEHSDWPAVADLMLESAATLAGGGAIFLFCPTNTSPRAWPPVVPPSPRRWPHIAGVPPDEGSARRYRRLGILGTRWLIE